MLARRINSTGWPIGSAPDSSRTWTVNGGPSLVSTTRPCRQLARTLHEAKTASSTRNVAATVVAMGWIVRRSGMVGCLLEGRSDHGSSVGPFAREDLGGGASHEDGRLGLGPLQLEVAARQVRQDPSRGSACQHTGDADRTGPG